MRHALTLIVFLGLFVPSMSLYAADERAVMGNWEGRWLGSDFAEGPISAQIIAEGKGSFRAVISVTVEGSGPFAGEMRGEDRGDKVAFKGTVDVGTEYGGVYEIAGGISNGSFAGEFSGSENRGKFELKKVRKTSPTLGAKPPEGAIVLFDGKDISKWVKSKTEPNPWLPVGDAMEVRNGSVQTVQEFGSFKLHLEFRTPFEPEARGQGRGNSGVYLPGGNEIQVLDSFGLPASKYDCAAFYGQAAPSVNACLPPEEWQTYDVTYIAPRFDEKGDSTENARITVLHNGIKIHDEFQPSRKPVPKGGILLQDHGNKVQYRNIWLVPLASQ